MTAAYDVAIVVRDHAPTLPACLAAVARLEPAPAHIVVVDNGSRDGSAELVASTTIDRLEVVRSATNLGFAGGLNRALAATSSPWILSLNPDCAPATDYAGRLLAAGAADPTCGAATGKLLRADGADLAATAVIDAAGMVVTRSGRHFDRAAGEPDDGRVDLPARVFGGTGAATLYRRAALEDIAYPDGQILAETFFAYREDAELAWRLQWRGWSCRYEPRAVASHRRGFRPEDGRRGHAEINRLSVRNRFLLRRHCADLGWHLWCFPAWLVRDTMVIAGCLVVEHSSLPALADVVRLWHDAGQRRRWVMARRTTSSRQIRRWFRTSGQVEELDET